MFMDILLIVLSLIAAYALFVSVSYLLIRLLFPKIEVDDIDEVKPLRSRTENRYATRTGKKQKNLAYERPGFFLCSSQTNSQCRNHRRPIGCRQRSG